MSIFYCNKCSKAYNNSDRKPLSLPCGDVFCKQCIYQLYDNKKHNINCPIHKKDITIEFNKIPICSIILENLIKKKPIESKDNYLYCIRHNKKKLKYFCEQDKVFLCDYCLEQHNGHKYIDFKLTKDNFVYEINALENDFENYKNKYLVYKKQKKIFISLIKKHIEEQIFKINNYFNNIINIINERKNKYILKMNNILQENSKKFDKLQNFFSICDEKCSFINNEFYYITNDLLNKGKYEIFYNLKNKFIQEINNIKKIINENIYNNNEIIINNNLPTFITPKNGIEKYIEKEEEIFGKFEDKIIDIDKNDKNKESISPETKINNNKIKNFNNKKDDNYNEDEKIIINNINKNNKERTNDNSLNYLLSNNLDSSSLLTKKSNMNYSNINDSSIIEKQLIDTGFTFFLINKNDVKNVFKQQESEHSQSEQINTPNINNNKCNDIFEKKDKLFVEKNNNYNNINDINKNNYNNNYNNINTAKNNSINKNLKNKNITNKTNYNNFKDNVNQIIKNNNYTIQNNNFQTNNYNFFNNQNNEYKNKNNFKNIFSNLNNFNTTSAKNESKFLDIFNNDKDKNKNYKEDELIYYQRINEINDKGKKARDLRKNKYKDMSPKNLFIEKEKSAHLISYKNKKFEKFKSFNVTKSEDNFKNKTRKTKVNNVNNNKENSTKRIEHSEKNINLKILKKNNIFGNSKPKNLSNNAIKGPISYIYSNKDNNTPNYNLINSYKKEYFNKNNFYNENNNEPKKNNNNIQKYLIMNKDNFHTLNGININNNNYNNQSNRILREYIYSPNKKDKKMTKNKYSMKEINKNNIYISNIFENNRYNEINNNNYELDINKGKKIRQKLYKTEMNSMDIFKGNY